jgi:hypothetical protein
VKQKYEVKGRVNGRQEVLRVGLSIFEVSKVRRLPSCYTLVVCARGSLNKKEEPAIVRFALKGKWWTSQDDQHWQIKRNTITRSDGFNGPLSLGEHEANMIFENLTKGNTSLWINIQGTHLGGKISFKIPF